MNTTLRGLDKDGMDIIFMLTWPGRMGRKHDHSPGHTVLGLRWSSVGSSTLSSEITATGDICKKNPH